MITAGVDIGARSIEIVLFDGKDVLEYRILSSGINPRRTAEQAFDELLESDIFEKSGGLGRVVATGYGRNHFGIADAAASEIVCHATGVAYHFPDAELVVDIGGQDSKVIEMEKGGKVKNFAMNDRCAAGTGKFLEIMASTLEIPLEKAGELGMNADGTCEINSMCAVFAESEIIGLLQNGVPVDRILNGVFHSVVRRTVSLLGRTRASDSLVFTGGVAKNKGVVKALGEETKCKILLPPEPQITGALGAAIIGLRQMEASGGA